MIVNATDEGWEVIHQQAHGLLAVQLAVNWKPELRPIRWIETLIALTEHDDGQEEWAGKNHLTKTGAPKDFQIQEYSVTQARNMVTIALEKSRWNALMVSMHARFLYEPMQGKDPQMDEFLEQQRKNQKDWLRKLAVTKEEAQYAYAFLQWCDAFSLILVQGHIPPSQRRLEISPGPDGVSYYLSQRADQTLLVDPWPFECDEFTAHTEVYHLNELSFKNDQELYDAIGKAPIEERKWTIKA
ncbi:DUF3891 family protein [Tellurirhabdus bombi]|uniref:DUF3891 family protein n=1 Tax=Tellurirhabdus bombi TaxID=2907205 RepID=UPI001F17A27C|nr:DUF3891 family protein [Tellurirhabdus bombi]